MRILEIGDNKAAGYCGRLFSLNGSEVIRVDLPTLTEASSIEKARDIYLHAGKKRVCIEYRQDAGQSLLTRLASECDMVISDLSPIELDEIDWETLPTKLRVSITPFGRDGPYRTWKASGSTLLAMGGYTNLMGDEGREPLTLPGNYAEYQAGQYAYTAALACTTYKSGCRNIDVSVLETVLSLSQFTTVMWTCQGVIRSRHGNRFGSLHPISLYPCKDGSVFINIVPDFWPNLVDMLGKPELLEDERFNTSPGRVENYKALDAIIIEAFSRQTMSELLESGQRKYRLPIGEVMTMEQVLSDEHLNLRHYWCKVSVGDEVLKIPGLAFRTLPLKPQKNQTWVSKDG